MIVSKLNYKTDISALGR